MLVSILTLWNKSKVYLVGALLLLLAIFGLYKKVKNDGAEGERRKNTEEVGAAVERRNLDRARIAADPLDPRDELYKQTIEHDKRVLSTK